MSKFNLPKDYKPYIDKYFLRAKEILIQDYLNPVVKYQVFIRKGNCKVYGINEAIAILTKYSKKINKIYALKEGSHFDPCETLMTIEAPVQELIDLETMYLGVLSAETTLGNGKDINLGDIYEKMWQIVELIRPRTVAYFGARHWRYDRDYEISKECFNAGANNCSTDIGASSVGQKGIGTIPHALQAIYHWKYGIENAVTESTISFDTYMPKDIPRIALVDYGNREVTDSIMTNYKVKNLYGIRIDTCGENYIQGTVKEKGVSVSGIIVLRRVLPRIKIMLSSGFGNLQKVKDFLNAEKIYKITLFNGLGVGGVFESRMATSDIIEVDGQSIHKVGRPYRPNERLERVI